MPDSVKMISDIPGLILLVEDEPSDINMIKKYLGQGYPNIKLEIREDGETAIDYLKESLLPIGPELPNLILLDLNLPNLDGREVLTKIKEDSKLRLIPVIVLTSSADERDIVQSYFRGCNAYVRKPLKPQDMKLRVLDIVGHWLGVCLLPRTESVREG